MATRKIGKYDIVERLGRGGMAEVYRAYHANLDRYVAIKVLHAFLADDPEFKGRFEREAQNVAKLKHPNIVQVYDFDFDAPSESYYMVMELVDGPTLKDRLTSMSDPDELLPLPEVLRIIREAAGALAYAHSRNMIHRDVKPANLMLDHDDRVVLTDFGIAKIVTGAQFTASGGMVGTPAYMAPEQGLGEAGDERSDLYSLGIILFQLVTGKLPYDAETPLAIILKHLNTPTPSARSVNSNVSEAIDRLIAKDPEDRYQSAADMIQDLERIERGEDIGRARTGNKPAVPPVVTSPAQDTLKIDPDDTPTQRLTQPMRAAIEPARRRGLPWWGWMSLLVVLVAVVAFVALNRDQLVALLGTTLTPTSVITQVAEVPSPEVTAATVEVVAPPGTATTVVPTSQTPSKTPSVTFPPTATPSATLTPLTPSTATFTPSPTRTLRPTSTPTPTKTFTPRPTDTPRLTDTPAPNLTETAAALAAVQTATATACIFDYAIIEQDPVDGGLARANSAYARKIVLENTGNCVWEPNTLLAYVEGESFSAGPRIFIQESVGVGKRVELQFVGKTPLRGAPYTGIWELRTPNQRKIGESIEISIQVYEGG
ncbi:MAG TPA: protein kinase [Phototrophicaceae bacterium]|nr:protein kinase [Phototrophicaceae bacterium]